MGGEISDMEINPPPTFNLSGILLKEKIKSTYHVLLNKNIIRLLREAEFKFNIRDKNADE